jgi:hypothetical protein
MFSDPTSITDGVVLAPSGGTAKSCARIRTDGYASEYATSDGLYKLKITHTRGSRTRTEVRGDIVSTYTDPNTGLASEITTSAYVVINRPLAGFTNTQIKGVLFAICGFAGVTANADKLLALES